MHGGIAMVEMGQGDEFPSDVMCWHEGMERKEIRRCQTY